MLSATAILIILILSLYPPPFWGASSTTTSQPLPTLSGTGNPPTIEPLHVTRIVYWTQTLTEGFTRTYQFAGVTDNGTISWFSQKITDTETIITNPQGGRVIRSHDVTRIFKAHSVGNAYTDVGALVNITGYGAEVPLNILAQKGEMLQGNASFNLWFDQDGNGEFFAWNSSAPKIGLFSGLGHDGYALGARSPNDNPNLISITNKTKFFIQAIGGGSCAFCSTHGYTWTLKQLDEGALPGISGATMVGIWVGNVSNSTSFINYDSEN